MIVFMNDMALYQYNAAVTDFFFQNAVQTDNKLLLENKSKFVLVHSSSGFKHSLRGNVAVLKLLNLKYC